MLEALEMQCLNPQISDSKLVNRLPPKYEEEFRGTSKRFLARTQIKV